MQQMQGETHKKKICNLILKFYDLSNRELMTIVKSCDPPRSV